MAYRQINIIVPCCNKGRLILVYNSQHSYILESTPNISEKCDLIHVQKIIHSVCIFNKSPIRVVLKCIALNSFFIN